MWVTPLFATDWRLGKGSAVTCMEACQEGEPWEHNQTVKGDPRREISRDNESKPLWILQSAMAASATIFDLAMARERAGGVYNAHAVSSISSWRKPEVEGTENNIKGTTAAIK